MVGRRKAADRRRELFGPAATARRHGISNQLLFAWRKAYCEGRLGAAPVSGFVPAVILPEQPERGAGDGRLEVVSANGRRVLVDRDVDVETLVLSRKIRKQPICGMQGAVTFFFNPATRRYEVCIRCGPPCRGTRHVADCQYGYSY